MHSQRNMKRFGTYVIILLIVIYLFAFIQTPYVILQPGSVTNVGQLIQVEEDEAADTGSLNMVTVSLDTTVSMLQLAYAYFHPYLELSDKSRIFRTGESKEQYFERQSYKMSKSHSDAIIAAYEQAGIAYELVTEEIRVDAVIEGFPAEGILQAGDRITALDGIQMNTDEQLMEVMGGKQEGDQVEVTYLRGDEEQSATVSLSSYPEEVPEEERGILGIKLSYIQDVKPKDPRHEVQIEVEGVGGPSAGMMFALEIYNQLTAGDLSKGYQIVGTGEISVDGTVKVIGGIEHKVLAAHRAEADIFFTPTDYYPPEGSGYDPVLNHQDALERAEDIGTEMDIVPVATLQEAIEYLESLPPKQQAS
ncbi:SepM family pheromone-processing serine protease [Marinicrinis sediminis]|uniref:endopeptidase La n=1 Tax=Marinicrinis sediminis TaxID=1652465 RepID=A0ABW5R5D1_9BACL